MAVQSADDDVMVGFALARMVTVEDDLSTFCVDAGS
jgi:hypothetical protein